MDLNIRNVPEEVMKAVKSQAGERLLTVRAFAIEALARHTKTDISRLGREVPKPDVPAQGTVSEDEVRACKRCGGEVRRDPKNPKFWRCPKAPGRCGRQLDEGEVKP